MSYTNPNQTADYTYTGTTLANVSVGLSTTETDNYYAQHLTVASGGKVKQNIRVSNGGILENAVIDYYGASVGSGGLISNALLSGASTSRTTFYVYSGGVASRITMLDSAYVSAVSGATLKDVIVSGGYFTASGATVTSVILDAPLHYNSTTLAALSGATVTSVTVNWGTFSLTNATATSVTVNAGTFSVSSGGTASYINVTDTGNLVVNSGGTAVTLAGNVVKTAIVMGGGYLSLNNGAVVSNIDVRPGGRLGPWAGSIISGGKIVGGNTATQPEIYGTIRDVELYSIDGKAAGGNSAWLRLTGNGKAFVMRISSGGKFQINSGTAEDTTVYSAGYIVVYGNGGNSLATRTTISSGASGVVYAGAGKPAVSMNDTWIMSGASLGVGLSGAAVDTVVNPGAILNLTDATANATIDEHPWLDKSCITAVEGATVTYERLHNVYYGADDESIGLVSRGAAISGATVEAGYSAVAYQGVALTDVNVADGGKLVLKDYAYVMGGSANSVAAGKIYLGDNATADTLGIVGSQLTGLTLASNTDHSHLSQVTLQSGLTATNATMLAGGTFYISNGAKVDGLEIVAGTVSAYDGGVIANATISGATTANRGFLYLNGAGAVANNVTLLDNAYASNCGATVNDLTISGGYFTANGVTVNGATLDKPQHNTGSTTLDAISGTTVSGVTVNYGTLVLRTGAFASDTTINGGTLNINGGDVAGTASGAVLLAGAVSVGAGATLSGAIVRGGAFYAYGIASDVTISNGGVFSAYKIGDGTTAAGQKIIVSEGGNAYAQTSGAMMSDVTVYSGGTVTLWQASVNGADIAGSAVLWGGGKLNDAVVRDGANIAVNNLAVASNINVVGGVVDVKVGGTANDVTIGEGGAATVAGTLNVKTSAWNVTVSNGGTVNVASGMTVVDIKTNAGAHVDVVRDENRATIAGDKTNIAASTFFYAGSANALGMSVVNGVVKNLGADGNYYRLAFGSGITIEDAMVNNGWRISAFNDAVVSGGLTDGGDGVAVTVLRDNAVAVGMTLSGTVGAKTSGLLNVWDDATAGDIIVSNGGVLRLNRSGTVAKGTVIDAGGNLHFNSATNADPSLVADANGATIDNTIIKAGGSLTFGAGITTVHTGAKMTLDFTGTTGDQSVAISDLGLVNAETEIVLKGATAGNTYTIADTGSTEKYVNCDPWGAYDNAVKADETILNAFGGMIYSFDAAGKAITATALTAEQAPAVLNTAVSLNDAGTEIHYDPASSELYDLAAVWTNFSVNSGSVCAITEYTEGGAWLKLEGTDLSGARLYGTEAEVEIDGGMNLYLTSGAVVGNLAAGAGTSGGVAGVKLTIDSATIQGVGYAGGFGDVGHYEGDFVKDDVTTYVRNGDFGKDFYAGALANYAKTGKATRTGNVTLTVDSGSFGGNLYGASAVKAGSSGGSNIHTVNDVNITLNDGSATNTNSDFCLFGAGYATGTGSSTDTVYSVNSVTIDINGGSWGTAHGGRGIFGGVFASGVWAQAGDVNISITGGTFGNVYGGGWAQKGGTSIVGNVSISISGGTIANVFGGGTHSVTAPGGSTTAGNVSINVSGGTITGDIFARGQSAGDVVTGDVCVTFTGDTNQSCGVYGYSYVGGEKSDAVLNYTAYTGTFSGAIGGFNGIVFDDDTAMTLSTAADDVTNSNWEFDFTDRA
ncbi:MAG: hypothetical protein J6Y54_02320, partial [Lentisphaeria bacterium]|nr:hypothetical protein [Lentisphaeria bacterium]